MLNYWYVWIVALLLLVIAAGFVARFVMPALGLRREFAEVVAALRGIGADVGATADLRSRIGEAVMRPASFAHVWAEYAQTLHAQRTPGQEETRWRATALAETFFTDQALVDTPLKTEYYKHLPGILTGLGIIGTFTGLIVGLGNFDVSIEPGQAQAQLRTLINSVGHAFVVSAVAITLAMIFTWVEKSLVTACYRLTEHMRQEIDSLFDTGADVEYLERLVAAAESSAREAAALKDTLGGEFARALAEQTQRQIDAGERNSELVAAKLGQMLAGSLAQPIAAIAGAVDAVGQRQDETVARMLTEVLSGFSAQMENMFAGRMRELHEVLSGTNAAMGALVGEFGAMAARLDAAGQEAVAAMGARIEQTVALVEARQLAMQQQGGSHAEQIAGLVARAQADAADMQRQLLAQLGDAVAAAVAGLREQSRLAVDGQQAQAERLAATAAASSADMTGQVERLVAMSIATNRALQETVAALARSSGEAVRGMNEGAASLGAAASSFAAAGTAVAATLGESARASADIRLAAEAMRTSAEVGRQMLGDYSDAHDAFARLAGDLKATVDRARREASLSAELTDRLEAAAGRLSHAQQQADTYLDGVSKVLGHAHQAFADSVERTLREANRQFQGELSQAVGLLSGAIVDLGNTVEALSEQDGARAGRAA